MQFLIEKTNKFYFENFDFRQLSFCGIRGQSKQSCGTNESIKKQLSRYEKEL